MTGTAEHHCPRARDDRHWIHTAGGALTLTVGLMISGPVSAQTTIGSFDFDNWAVCAECGPYSSREDVTAPGSYEAAVMESGGNTDGSGDDGWLQTTLILPTVEEGSISFWGAVFDDTLTWDPAEEANGPIATLDFDVDGRMDEGPPSRIYTLGVLQDGYVWGAVQKRIFMDDTDWTATPISCLSEKDFEPLPFSRVAEQPAKPDFSASGSLITFGLVQGNSCPETADCSEPITRVFGMDNFSVTINQGFRINPGVADAWYNPETNGQGIYTTVFPELDLMALAWFTFAPGADRPPADPDPLDIGEPEQRWITAIGPYCGDTANLTLLRTTGGLFDMPPALDNDDTDEIGTAVLQWADCDTANLKYEMPDLGLEGDVPLQRVAPNSALCEEWLGPRD